MMTTLVPLALEARKNDRDESWARRMARLGRLVAVKVGDRWLCQPGAIALLTPVPLGYPKGRPRGPRQATTTT